MKKLLTLTVLLSITIISFCQDVNSETKMLSKADYLKKSKTQKIVGWCLAGTGTGIIAVALISQASEDAFVSLWGRDVQNNYDYTNYTGYYVAGAVVLASGIAFLATSKMNKNKALAVTAHIKMENSKQIKSFGTATIVTYPALAIRINL